MAAAHGTPERLSRRAHSLDSGPDVHCPVLSALLKPTSLQATGLAAAGDWEEVAVAFPGFFPLAHNKIVALQRDPIMTWMNREGHEVVQHQATVRQCRARASKHHCVQGEAPRAAIRDMRATATLKNSSCADSPSRPALARLS